MAEVASRVDEQERNALVVCAEIVWVTMGVFACHWSVSKWLTRCWFVSTTVHRQPDPQVDW
jgi:hypothetical protein